MYDIYQFNSAEQKCKTFAGDDYVLHKPCLLLKLHTPFPKSLNHSYYFILNKRLVIDCHGYIETRCLEKVDSN